LKNSPQIVEAVIHGGLQGELEVREREREWGIRRRWENENNGTHRTLDSAVDFGPGKEVPHLSSRTARLRATCHRRFSRIAPRYRTPCGSRGSRTKRPNWIRGLPRAVRKGEITVPGCPI